MVGLGRETHFTWLVLVGNDTFMVGLGRGGHFHGSSW